MCEKRKEKGMIERKVVLTVWWHRKDEKKTYERNGKGDGEEHARCYTAKSQDEEKKGEKEEGRGEEKRW